MMTWSGVRSQRGSNYDLLVMIVVFLVLISLILFPLFHKARVAARDSTCMSNVKCISLGLLQYAQDYDKRFLPAEAWNESRGLDSKAVLICPTVGGAMPCYALNKAIAGAVVERVADKARVVAIFESLPGANQAGGSELLPKPGRHNKGNHIGFADGHVKWYKDGSYKELLWRP